MTTHPQTIPTGSPGQFDFLIGNWHINQRRWDATTKTWDHFEGESTCWSILGGQCSIEELRIPARNFFGMGLRVFDGESQTWHDHWYSGRMAKLYSPGVAGGFVNGVGTFISEESDAEGHYLVRGMWDEITGNACRWQQAISRDGGTTWQDNWVMHWQRQP